MALLHSNKGKIIVVVGEEMKLTTEFCNFLVGCGLPKVCSLSGGISTLQNYRHEEILVKLS
uniref:Tbc domain-containing protein kinase-like protein n=2 Tax=Triatoma infestans TaxID=30076 RepID=A0A170UVA8_TRIIF